MQISDVTVDLFDVPPAQPAYRWRDGLPLPGAAEIGGTLRVHTKEGVTGEARTRRGVIVRDIVERCLRDELVGMNSLGRERVWHRVWELNRVEEIPIYALGLVDIALWDLAGKAAGAPVHELLGTFRDSIPAYANTVTYGSVEEYLDIADQAVARGFTAIKIHAWGDARRDAELCLQLRAHVGDSVPLMYDGSGAFNLSEAVYIGKALSEADYLWYEEPMREWNITAHKWLADAIDVPLLVGEVAHGAHMNIADFIASGCAKFVRTEATKKAGITGALRVAHLAEAFLMNAEVHGMSIVNQHLCMAIPNTTYYEARVWGNPITTGAEVQPDGTIVAPTVPGIGWPSQEQSA